MSDDRAKKWAGRVAELAVTSGACNQFGLQALLEREASKLFAQIPVPGPIPTIEGVTVRDATFVTPKNRITAPRARSLKAHRKR